MKEIKLNIDHFDDDTVVLKKDNGRKVLWPVADIPEEAKIGDIVVFKIATADEKEKHDRGVAKSILNEILNPE